MTKVNFIFGILFLAACSHSALAFPNIGDQANYAGTTGTSGTSMISMITALDGEGGYIKQDTSFTDGVQTSNGNTHVLAVEAQMVDNLVHSGDSDANCQHMVDATAGDGSTATLEPMLVAGTTMYVCHINFPAMPQPNGSNQVIDFWYGNVPFGIIKYSATSSSGPISNLELTAYLMH